jgi:hypothetical protein
MYLASSPYQLRGGITQMTAQDHTSTVPENQAEPVKQALNLRWKYYKTRSGIPVKTFASDALDALPHAFLPITAEEYDRLERQS